VFSPLGDWFIPLTHSSSREHYPLQLDEAAVVVASMENYRSDYDRSVLPSRRSHHRVFLDVSNVYA
jgi:hypothetical protein